jgi:hypothetical protein
MVRPEEEFEDGITEGAEILNKTAFEKDEADAAQIRDLEAKGFLEVCKERAKKEGIPLSKAMSEVSREHSWLHEAFLEQQREALTTRRK